MDDVLEFVLAGNTYKASRLDAVSQIHIVRRLAPILTTLKTVAAEGGGEAAIQPAVEALGSVSDEAVEYVVRKCMSRVQRKRPHDTGWTAIWNVSAGRPQFDDLGGFEVLWITSHVVMNELGPFFSGLASSLSAGGQP